MSRMSTILIVIAMVVTAISLTIVLNVQFGFTLGQAAVLGLAVLFGLALLHVHTQRRKDREWLEMRIREISAVAGDVNSEIDTVASRLARMENSLGERIREENEPLAAEVEVIGRLMKQVADALAEVETRMERRVDEVSARVDQPRLPPPQAAAQAVRMAQHSQAQALPPSPAHGQPQGGFAPPSRAARPDVGRADGQAPEPYLHPPQAPSAHPQSYQAPPVMPAEPLVPRAEAAGLSHGLGPMLAGSGAPPAASGQDDNAARLPSPFEREVEALIRGERIEVHLQPIVTLPQRKVRYYEVFTRLRAADARLIPAAEFLPAAEARRVVSRLDTFQVIRSFQILKRLTQRNRDIGIFVNLSVASLMDATFFREFQTFLVQNKGMADLVQFEFTEQAVRDLGPLEMESLAGLADYGYRFSLDNLVDTRLDLQRLHEIGFRTIKIAADRLLGRAPFVAGDIHPADLSGHLGRAGYTLVVDRIEQETQVVDLLDYEVKFAQGNLFSAPRQVRPEILGQAAGPAAGQGGPVRAGSKAGGR
ncbi:EAL domain-containing protein [Mongoliimonas terrestris]|uniref:EAL domain-containing protein n=1 Tax=Mongoliimonas terrestris TaxID=1709001 RepID=UPI0009FB289E|nr:EAL domain-containing protein [Mongoliimonas terrestris]